MRIHTVTLARHMNHTCRTSRVQFLVFGEDIPAVQVGGHHFLLLLPRELEAMKEDTYDSKSLDPYYYERRTTHI